MMNTLLHNAETMTPYRLSSYGIIYFLTSDMIPFIHRNDAGNILYA